MGVRDWWGWTPLCVGGLLALSWRERHHDRLEKRIEAVAANSLDALIVVGERLDRLEASHQLGGLPGHGHFGSGHGPA